MSKTRKELTEFLKQNTKHTAAHLADCEVETLEYLYVVVRQRLRRAQAVADYNAEKIFNFLNKPVYKPLNTKPNEESK